MTTIFVKDGLVYSDTRITTTTYKDDEVVDVNYSEESKVESVDFHCKIDGVEHHFIKAIGAGRCKDINRRIIELTHRWRGWADGNQTPNYSIFFITDAGLIFKDTPDKPMFKIGRYAKAGSGATNPGICCIGVFSPKLAVQAASIVDKHTGGRVECTQGSTTMDVGACGSVGARWALLGTWSLLGTLLLSTLPVWLPLGFGIRGFYMLKKRILK